MSNDIKKQRVKKLLDSIQEAADKFSSLKGTTDNQTEIIEFKPKDMQ
jgi:hypothetical protein